MSRVLVVGDVMLDEFVYGDVHRISPEAATPVLTVKRVERMCGGAGNVARGIAALDCEVDLVSIIGDDEVGRKLLREIHATVPHSPWMTISTERKTTHKQRFVSDQHSAHLLRVDTEDTTEIHGVLEATVLNRAAKCLMECDALVISDYCKGIVTRTLARGLIDIARVQDKPVLVDSKRDDLSMFADATLVKVNLCELGFCFDEPSLEAIAAAAHTLGATHSIETVVVTRGENGLSAFTNKGEALHYPGRPVRVRDVSGAGDTVVATLAVFLAGGLPLDVALERANAAASIAVSKPGTATVSLAELRGGTKIAPHEDWSLVDQRVREWRGKRIGFVNGCFDLLHTGHLHLLTHARSNCDRLIVAINSDDAVRKIKGADRPIQSHMERAQMLAALSDLVDLVVIFDGDDPTPVIERIRPAAMFVGDDYLPAQVKGREFSGTLHIVPRILDVSTTNIVGRMRDPAADLLRETIEHARTHPTTIDRLMSGEPWCNECHGPCNRRPRHGEFTI